MPNRETPDLPFQESVPSNPEQELKHKAHDLVANFDTIVREFSTQQISEDQLQEKWKAHFQDNLKKRLAGEPEARYLMNFRKMAESMSEEKEKVITASLLFELANRGDMKPLKKYNKPILFRLAIEMVKEKKGTLLGTAVEEYLTTIPLNELEETLLDTPGATADYRDLPRLATVALGRIQSEPETTQKILRRVEHRMFQATPKSVKQLDNFFESAPIFGAEVASQVLFDMQQREPEKLKRLFQLFDEELEKNLSQDEAVIDAAKKLNHGEWIIWSMSNEDLIKRVGQHRLRIKFIREIYRHLQISAGGVIIIQ